MGRKKKNHILFYICARLAMLGTFDTGFIPDTIPTLALEVLSRGSVGGTGMYSRMHSLQSSTLSQLIPSYCILNCNFSCTVARISFT